MNKAMIKGDNGKFEYRSIEVLYDAVVAHYTKIGLYDHATPLKQQCYALTEAGETTKAVLVNDLPEIKDGIGDILVCVINWAQLANIDFVGQYELHETTQVEMSAEEMMCCIHIDLAVLSEYPEDDSLAMLFEHLQFVARQYDLTLADCLGCAYDVVIKRKIKFLNGVAIKDADWHKFPELAEDCE